MPRYFFHLRNHDDKIIDPEGRCIEAPEQIPAIALHEARAIIADDALSGVINLRQRIDVEDEAGILICSISFADACRVLGA